MGFVRGHSWLRARVIVLVATGSLIVAGGVTLLLANTIALRGSAESTRRTDRYLLRVLEVERLVVDAETGLRGYVITGRTVFLQPLRRAQSEVGAAISALQQTASHNHLYQQRTASLITAVRSYLGVYVRDALALATRDLSAVQSFSMTMVGKRQVDSIRAQVAELERLLSGSQAQRQTAATRTADRSIADAIAALVILTLLTGGVGGYLAHLVVQRERARASSEDTARILQESILPPAIPAIPGLELATRFVPGGGPVGGDFYDVFELEPDRWAVSLGDVCGKGAQAAAATAMARWSLQSSMASGATPGEALRFLNDVVRRNDHDGRFITAVCMRVNLKADSARIEVACAGHPPPILVPRGGAARAVPADGDLLGVLPDIRLRLAEVELRAGDSLVAYTDGVTDLGPEMRRSPEDALQERGPDADAEQLARILDELAHQPAGGHPDDVAIVALRFVGESGQVVPDGATTRDREPSAAS